MTLNKVYARVFTDGLGMVCTIPNSNYVRAVSGLPAPTSALLAGVKHNLKFLRTFVPYYEWLPVPRYIGFRFHQQPDNKDHRFTLASLKCVLRLPNLRPSPHHPSRPR